MSNSTKAEPNGSPRCRHCGSERIFRDAWTEWDFDSQQWEWYSTFDDAFCEPCDGETKISWIKITEEES